MNIYEYESYKSFLKDRISQGKRPGIMTELAKSIGCDRTYLSQVLSGKAQLTADHAINLAEAFSLNPEESDFFLLLVLKERSSLVKARRKFEEKIEKMRKEHLDLTKKIRTSEAPAELSDAIKLRYYSSWKFSAAHILTSISNCQALTPLAQTLGCSEKEASGILEELVRMGLVKKSGSRFMHGGKNLHIPAGSPLVTFNHLNWRMRAMESASGNVGTHYTDVFSISAKDFPVLQGLLLEFIEKLRQRVRESGAEEAYVLSCDFLPITRS